MTNIKERPEEVEGRLVPGHWEGDLIVGAGGSSAIGTLVERTTRLVILVRLPTKKADVAASAFAGALNAIPAPLRKTLTYDQGKEMAAHAQLALDTGMRIFFADQRHAGIRGTLQISDVSRAQVRNLVDQTADDDDVVKILRIAQPLVRLHQHAATRRQRAHRVGQDGPSAKDLPAAVPLIGGQPEDVDEIGEGVKRKAAGEDEAG